MIKINKKLFFFEKAQKKNAKLIFKDKFFFRFLIISDNFLESGNIEININNLKISFLTFFKTKT